MAYYSGEGVPEDKAEAIKWFRKATEQGLSVAQYCLGMCYFEGEGVAANKTEAVKWLRKAANQGFEEATTALQNIEQEQSDTEPATE